MDTSPQTRPTPNVTAPLFTIGILVAVVVAIAYFGTEVYNFFIPTVIQKKDFSLGIWTLAIVGGVVAVMGVINERTRLNNHRKTIIGLELGVVE
jgi:hypothetical protein